MSNVPKQRVRKPAAVRAPTGDSYQNLVARLGLGSENQHSASTYGFNPVTRNRIMLEWAYRGAWLVRQVVDAPAADMTRAGVVLNSTLDPGDTSKLHNAMRRLCIWQEIANTARWGRLYGGAIGFMLIDGQDPTSELRPETIGKDQFKGLYVLDRWMIQPTLTDLVTEIGPDLGKPRFYVSNAAVAGLGAVRVHHSRVIRMDGADLPYNQRQSENGWGISVIEPMYDRMTAFDSASMGTAQLVYKAYLRTMKVKNLRTNVAAGGKVLEGIAKTFEMMRLFQSNEGLSLIDADDDFQTHTFNFAGLSDIILQFGQQIAGATQIPLVRLFGQSPAGMNSTGESDIRLYYDGIAAQQEARLRRPMSTLIEVLCRSELGFATPDGFDFHFAPLWQLSDSEKADIATKDTATVMSAEGSGVVTRAIALKELRDSSRVTGRWTNITDDDIEEAENEPPLPDLEADPTGSGMIAEPGEKGPTDRVEEPEARAE